MEFQRSLKLHIYICVPRSYYIIMMMMVMMVMMMNDKRPQIYIESTFLPRDLPARD